jgi:superfamily I DNA and/or RNA helicase
MGRVSGSEASSATPKPKSSGSFSASDSSDDSSDDARRRTDDSRGGAPVHVVTSAVITFYSEQVRRVRRELAARGSLANAVAGSENGSVAAKKKTNRKRFRDEKQTKPPADRRAAHFPPPAVHTVDAFQGSEADVVVISAVRCNARGDVGFLADPRRLNVALTRAKSVCVFVGCVRTLRASGNPDLLALVRDSESRGLIATEAEARAWLELHK